MLLLLLQITIYEFENLFSDQLPQASLEIQDTLVLKVLPYFLTNDFSWKINTAMER